MLPPERLHQSSILIVEDDPVVSSLIESTLLSDGYTAVATAANGQEALDYLEQSLPDCVILDLVMPQMDGFEVCRRMRERDEWEHIPVIVQTAHTEILLRRKVFGAGATDLLTKPFDSHELLARIRVHVTNRILSRNLLTYREIMEAELNEARRVTETLLPSPEDLEEMERRGVQIRHFLSPSVRIGGDFFLAWPQNASKTALLVGDISGHGVSAALRASGFRAFALPPPPFAENCVAMAKHLDRRVKGKEGLSDYFVACVYGLFDHQTGIFEYIPGGLRDGILMSPSEGLSRIDCSGLPLGYGFGNRESKTIQLQPGDTLFLYSDALVETAGADPENRAAPESEDALIRWITKACDAIAEAGTVAQPSDVTAEHIGARFVDHFGPQITDDLLVVSLRFLPNAMEAPLRGLLPGLE